MSDEKKNPNRALRGCLDFVFPSPITLFTSPIAQNMWVPGLNSLFGDVFSFCFYQSFF